MIGVCTHPISGPMQKFGDEVIGDPRHDMPDMTPRNWCCTNLRNQFQPFGRNMRYFWKTLLFISEVNDLLLVNLNILDGYDSGVKTRLTGF